MLLNENLLSEAKIAMRLNEKTACGVGNCTMGRKSSIYLEFLGQREGKLSVQWYK